MRHRAHRSLLNRLRAPSRTLGAVVTLALLVAALVATSVVTASGPPDGTDEALEVPSSPGASYDPPTPSLTGSPTSSPDPRPSDAATISSSPTLRPTESPVSRSGDREPAVKTTEAVPSSEAPSPSEAPATEEPAPDAPETTATTRSANASRWVVGVGSDTDATYECSLDGGAYQACGTTVTYEDLDRGTHSFAARATDDEGNTDPSPATLTAEIGPRGQG